VVAEAGVAAGGPVDEAGVAADEVLDGGGVVGDDGGDQGAVGVGVETGGHSAVGGRLVSSDMMHGFPGGIPGWLDWSVPRAHANALRSTACRYGAQGYIGSGYLDRAWRAAQSRPDRRNHPSARKPIDLSAASACAVASLPCHCSVSANIP